MPTNSAHPADQFNRIRRIVLSCANNPSKGFDEAFKWLDGYYKRKEINHNGYIGLRAEIAFYRDNRQKYSLTPTLDAGDKCDFAGHISGRPSRFDVTINTTYKHFKDYEPFMNQGSGYHIVHCDKDSLKVLDIISLAFEPCNCGGWLVPFVVMLPENYDSNGNSLWTHSQRHVRRCTVCGDIDYLADFDHGFMPTPTEHEAGLRETKDLIGASDEEVREFEEQVSQVQKDYEDDCYRYFRQAFDLSIMALAEPHYHMTKSDGSGYWETGFPLINGVMSDIFPKTIEAL